MPTIRTMLVVCIPALFILLCQVGRIRRGNTRFADGLSAMGFRERRVRQTGSRLEERGRSGTAGGVDARHGGPTLLARAGDGSR